MFGTSGFVLAEMLVRSPCKLFTFVTCVSYLRFIFCVCGASPRSIGEHIPEYLFCYNENQLFQGDITDVSLLKQTKTGSKCSNDFILKITLNFFCILLPKKYFLLIILITNFRDDRTDIPSKTAILKCRCCGWMQLRVWSRLKVSPRTRSCLRLPPSRPQDPIPSHLNGRRVDLNWLTVRRRTSSVAQLLASPCHQDQPLMSRSCSPVLLF